MRALLVAAEPDEKIGEYILVPRFAARQWIGQEVDEGRGAYPLAHAVEDTVVDYHLEKFGRYLTNPFTSPHLPTARWVMKLLTRFAER